MDLTNDANGAISWTSTKLPTAFEVLSRTLEFADEGQLTSWHILGAMCAKMMLAADYSVHQQYEYLSFIYQYVLPLLGKPYTGFHGRQNEFYDQSINYQDSQTTVRTYLELPSRLAGTRWDPGDKLRVHSFLNRLHVAQHRRGIDTVLFSFFAEKLLLSQTEESHIRASEIAGKLAVRSQCPVAFEFKDGNIGVKSVLDPRLRALATGVSLHQLIFDALHSLPTLAGGEGFMPAVRSIEDYVASRISHTPNTTISAFFLALDMLQISRARIKCYFADTLVDWPTLESLWTLGGKVGTEDNTRGLYLLKEIWDILRIPEGLRRDSSHPLKLEIPETMKGFIVSYEIKAGRPEPSPKVYISLRGIDESTKCARITAIFRYLGWIRYADNYQDNLRSLFPSVDFEQVTTIQDCISFSYSGKSGPYMTVYFRQLDPTPASAIREVDR